MAGDRDWDNAFTGRGLHGAAARRRAAVGSAKR